MSELSQLATKEDKQKAYYRKYYLTHKEERRSKAKENYLPEYHREYRQANKVRIRKRNRAYEEANREKVAFSKWSAALRNDYAFSVAQYMETLESQGSGCALCGKSPDVNGRRLAVDHDHQCCPGEKCCGKCIRGLLCGLCNTHLGWAETIGLNSISQYLTRRSG